PDRPRQRALRACEAGVRRAGRGDGRHGARPDGWGYQDGGVDLGAFALRELLPDPLDGAGPGAVLLCGISDGGAPAGARGAASAPSGPVRPAPAEARSGLRQLTAGDATSVVHHQASWAKLRWSWLDLHVPLSSPAAGSSLRSGAPSTPSGTA